MEMGKKAWRKSIFVSVGLVCLGLLALNVWALNQEEDSNRLLVTVDGVKITRGDVNHKIDAILGSRATALPPDQRSEIRNNLDHRVLQNMIVEALLTKAVQEERVVLEEDEVQTVLDRLKASLPPDMDFAAYLKGIGFSEKELRRQIAKDLRIKKLLEARVAHLPAPTDEEIRLFYDENLEQFKTPEGKAVRHILVAVTPDDDEMNRKEKRARAEEIRLRLVDKGEDFAAVAAAESDCPSKTQGGDIGLVTKGSTVTSFEDAVYKQKLGEIGPVVETDFGYHIIEVMKDEKAGTTSLGEVKSSISDYLVSKKKEATLNAFIERLKSKADIVYHDKTLAEENPA